MGIIRRLRNKLNSTAFRKIFIKGIRPKKEHACAVWSGGPTGKIVKLQDAYCRRHQIHLPPLKKRFEYHTLTLFFKMKHQMVPQYLILLCLLLRQNQVNDIVSEKKFPILFLWFRKHHCYHTLEFLTSDISRSIKTLAHFSDSDSDSFI